MIDYFVLMVYGTPLLLIYVFILRSQRRKQQASLEILEENQKIGLTEPASIHPVIDPNLVKVVGPV